MVHRGNDSVVQGQARFGSAQQAHTKWMTSLRHQEPDDYDFVDRSIPETLGQLRLNASSDPWRLGDVGRREERTLGWLGRFLKMGSGRYRLRSRRFNQCRRRRVRRRARCCPRGDLV